MTLICRGAVNWGKPWKCSAPKPWTLGSTTGKRTWYRSQKHTLSFSHAATVSWTTRGRCCVTTAAAATRLWCGMIHWWTCQSGNGKKTGGRHWRFFKSWWKPRESTGRLEKILAGLELLRWLDYDFNSNISTLWSKCWLSSSPGCGPGVSTVSDLDPVVSPVHVLVRFEVSSRLMSSFDTNFFSLDYILTQSAAQRRLLMRLCACAFLCVCLCLCVTSLGFLIPQSPLIGCVKVHHLQNLL